MHGEIQRERTRICRPAYIAERFGSDIAVKIFSWYLKKFAKMIVSFVTISFILSISKSVEVQGVSIEEDLSLTLSQKLALDKVSSQCGNKIGMLSVKHFVNIKFCAFTRSLENK